MNFQTELNNYCNFTCGYCPNKDMERERQFMSDEVWQTILDRYIVPYHRLNLNAGHNPTFIGHKDSEPLLDKKLPLRLKALSDAVPSMNIDVYSNGVLLPAWAKRGQDFIQFLGSLPNRCRYLMSYHPVNHDGTVNDYNATVLYLKEVLKNKPPNVEFITVSHRSHFVNADAQEAWKDTWKEESARGAITVHANVDINNWTGRIEEGTVEFHGCPYADFGSMFFGVTGNIIACCMDLEEEIIFGNVMKDDPAEMVAKLDAFYKEQQRINAERTGLVHEVCRNCFGMGERQDLVQLGVVA